jgi:hypothetical protein
MSGDPNSVLARLLRETTVDGSPGWDVSERYFETATEPTPVSTEPDERDEPAAAVVGESHSWTPIDLTNIGNGPTERPTIAGHIYPSRRHSYFGDSETCKSLRAQMNCAELAQQEKHSIYIETDGAGRYETQRRRYETQRRFLALGLTDTQLAHIHYIEPGESIEDPTILAEIAALLERHRPELVVLDALDAFLELHGLNPNSNVEVQRGWRLLEPFRATGAAIICIDHVVKATEDRKQYAAGAGRKRYAVDVAIGFETIHPFGRGRTGRIKLVTHKDRPGYLPRPKLGELELHSDPDTGSITWTLALAEPGSTDTATPFRPTYLMERISRYVEAQTQPIARNALANEVTGKREYKLAAIRLLLDEAYLTETVGGAVVSTKPYRGANDA